MLQCLAAAGFTTSGDAAVRAWAEYSDDHCAGWLALPEDDATLRETLLKYLTDRGISDVWRVTASNAADGSDPLPAELTAKVGWQAGDELSIEMDDADTLMLRRV